MKATIPILFSSLLCLIPIAQAADNAYDIMVMEASTGKAKPATLAIDSKDEPAEIAFGVLKDGAFVGQRIIFRALETNTRRTEVIVEDVESPVTDIESGIIAQEVHKKVLTLEADGKSHTIEINGKKMTFKIYAIGGIGAANKLMIEQAAP